MKIAIHHSTHSFSEGWIQYCEQNKIDYKIVNAFDSNLIEQLKDCDIFMWHHYHNKFKDVIAAKKILFALEHAGVKVFPDFKTGWHFDDKVAQKYLLEAIHAPLVPSYVFYDQASAMEWAKATTYPKVFKLKGGAGSSNVRLVRNQQEAIKLIRIAFGRGFLQFNRFSHFKDRYNVFRSGKGSWLDLVKGFGRLFIIPEFAKQQAPERGYIYFQEFMPNNQFDTRIVVIHGQVAAAEKRFVREHDFRASGSGNFSYDDINLDMVKISFEVAKQLKLQSVAFDFILDTNNQPVIVEMSYGFGVGGISHVPGYWDDQLQWHLGTFNPQQHIIEGVMNN